jgi:hypothetical protein
MAGSVDAGDGRRDFLTIRSDARESEWLSSGWSVEQGVERQNTENRAGVTNEPITAPFGR